MISRAGIMKRLFFAMVCVISIGMPLPVMADPGMDDAFADGAGVVTAPPHGGSMQVYAPTQPLRSPSSPVWSSPSCVLSPVDDTMLVGLYMFPWKDITLPVGWNTAKDNGLSVSAGISGVFPIPNSTSFTDASHRILDMIHAKVIASVLVTMGRNEVVQPVAAGGGAEFSASIKGQIGQGMEGYDFALRGHDFLSNRLHLRGAYCGPIGNAWIVHDDNIGMLGIVTPG